MHVLLLIPLIASAVPEIMEAGAFDFNKHWQTPIPPQGKPPKEFSGKEASLLPQDCGVCHVEQYVDWSNSRHSLSMGPGVLGQLNEPWLDRKTQELCLNCHAPLGEQRKYSFREEEEPGPNPVRDEELALTGLSCSACHVRKHVRYGPASEKVLDSPLPHSGFVAVENFGDSRFCRPCHQFETWGRKVNGKLLEDTYAQWQRSDYAVDGIRCADCHMPGRRHFWKGIHDRQMVKDGVDINTGYDGENVTVTIENNGVGHYFPTYVTPQVAIRLFHITGGNEELVGERWIGWKVSLDLSEEIYDTRIKPGGARAFVFKAPRARSDDEKLLLRVFVYPDEFYNRFFKSLISDPQDGVDIALIREAYEGSQKSAFALFEKEWNINR